jgi:TrmH family RNA methyltransferase
LTPPPEFDRLRLILVNTRNPLNIGAAARAMSNFGVPHLRVVTPYEPAFREARSAVGAAPVLAAAQECKTVAEAVADCALVVGTTAVGHRNLKHRLRLLPEGAALIRKHLAAGKVGLMFGSEKVGLSNEDLAHCHWLLQIPARKEHTSMNLGQAVAICLYELARDHTVHRLQPAGTAASADDIERTASALLTVLRASGYEVPGSAVSTQRKVRQFLRHLTMRRTDATLLLGMVRQILWKLRQAEERSGSGSRSRTR